jgi:SRSO17 transposase
MQRSDGEPDLGRGCSLAELQPVRLELVRDQAAWEAWKGIVARYHYLGVRRPTGRRLHYLLYARGQRIGALGWKGGSLRLAARDCFIGWSDQQRRELLDHVINNYRFVLVGSVCVPNLASHVLARGMKAVCQDWKDRYGVAPWVLETFVAPRFRGSCYRAAGWEAVGSSSGYGKRGARYAYHGERKDVYLYVVEKQFRTLIGCQRRSVPRVSGAVGNWEGQLHMMIQDAGYDPELIDWTEIDEAMQQDIAQELVEFHELFRDCFCRKEQRLLGLGYLRGLISDLPRKSVEPIALAFGGVSKVRGMQNFLSRYSWDETKMMERGHSLLRQSIGEKESMWCVDSTEIPKKGTESVGVARQYCGARGKIDNCQSGVFVSFTSAKGYGLLEGQLYLPQPWFSPEYAQRWEACKIPPKTQFATKIEIAQELLRRQKERGILHARWVGCDSFFGVDHNFRDEVAAMRMYYLAAIKPRSKVWRDGRSLSVAELAKDPALNWKRVSLAEGAKGPIVAEVTRIRVRDNRDDAPGLEQWLILRRCEDGRLKYYLSNASVHVAEWTLWKALVRRWPIEQCFEDGKKHLGMDQYENRSWKGWHRHMIYICLAMLFLLRLRLKFKKNSDADPPPGPAPVGRLPGWREAGQATGSCDSQVLHASKQGRLLLAPQEQAPPSEQEGPPLLIRSFRRQGSSCR